MAHEPRLRDYLTRDEVAALLRSSKKSPRYGARNYAMILLAYRHGLRVGELVELRSEQIDLQRGTLHVNRKKGGDAATHPISGRELRVLRQLNVSTPSRRSYSSPNAAGPSRKQRGARWSRGQDRRHA